MTWTLALIPFPYIEDFKVGRERRPQSRRVWTDEPVTFSEVAESDTTIAYVVTPGTRKDARTFTIRSYEGRLWWPVIAAGEPLTVGRFMTSAADATGYFIEALHLGRYLTSTPRDARREQIAEKFAPRKVHFLTSTRQKQLIGVQQLAADILFCGGLVYRRGGEPAYFAVLPKETDKPMLSLRIGSLDFVHQPIEDDWLIGPTTLDRQVCGRKGSIFSLDEVDDQFLKTRRGPHRLVRSDRIEISAVQPRQIDAVHACADAMARAVVRPPGFVSHAHLEAMERYRQLPDRPLPMPLAVEIIHTGLELSNNPRYDFGIDPDAARRILATQTLIAEDEEALAALG